MSRGFVLVSPKGRHIICTFSADRETTEGIAFDYLDALYTWPKSYWKQWDAFCQERERRRWKILPVKLVVMK